MTLTRWHRKLRQHETIEDKLKRHLVECPGSSMETLFPFVQASCQHLLNRQQNTRIYIGIRKVVTDTESYCFKQSQNDFYRTFRDDRVIQFYDILKCFPNWEKYKVGFIVTHYRRNFFQYEAVLQLQRLGVGLSSDKDLNVKQLSQQWYIKFVCEYFAYERHKYLNESHDYADYYFLRYGKSPSDNQIDSFEHKKRWFIRLIKQSGGVNTEKTFTFTEYRTSYNDEVMPRKTI